MAYGSNGKGSAFVYVVDKEKAYNLNVDFSNRHDLIMTNDIDYYYLSSSDELMRGRIKHQFFVEFLNSFSDVTGLCYIDAENIGVYGDKNFYIYSVKQDTIIYKSKPRPRWIDGWIIDEYDIRGVNSKYVVSGQGLYDIHRDSLIINSDSIYMFNNRPVTISTPNNQFIMRELNGKVIKKINLLPFDDYRIYDLCIAGNYLFITDGYETKLIYVFSLKDGMNKQRVKITDEAILS